MAGPAIWTVSEKARRRIWEKAGYEPTKEQLEAHLDTHRVKLVMGGERGGKSRWTAEELLIWGLVSDPGAFFWIVGPDYHLARPEAEHLIRSARKLKILDTKELSMPLEGSWRVKLLTGVEYITKTAADIEKIAGEAPAGVAMTEAGQQPYEAWLRLRGRVAERRAPLVLSGTVEASQRWYADLWMRWQGVNPEGARSFSLPTWSNRAIFPGGEEDPEILALKATYPPDVFQERFGAIPCKPSELVFPEFDTTIHVGNYPYRPGIPVHLWIDPGYAGAYAVVVVQIEKGIVYQVDEIYAVRRTVHSVIQECREKPWWKDVKSGIIDIAGRQHHGMESHVEIWRAEAGLRLYAQPVGIADGILRHRTFLRDPATEKPRLFHDHRCKNTIQEYGLYKYRRTTDGRPIREEPIDAYNHSMKALAYGLVGTFGYVPKRSRRLVLNFLRA